MKKIHWLLIMTVALTIAACGQASTPAVLPTVALDSSSQTTSQGKNATASAKVVPINNVELSFATGGVVKTVEVAAGDSVKAGQPLVTLDAAILQSRVAEAEANVVVAQTQLDYLIRTGTNGSQERLDAAKADVDRAKAEVDIAKAQLAQATLTAPFDGTVAAVNINPAEFASPGEVVIVMGDLSHFQIETTDLSEKNIPNVQVGQAVGIFIDALNKDFTGKVVDIARVSETVGGDVVYKVTIELDEQPEGLRWGMSAEVTIGAK